MTHRARKLTVSEAVRNCADTAPYDLRERLRSYAGEYTRRMIRRGLLPDLRRMNLRCTDCHRRADRYDHRDYRYPEFVQPVCVSCNGLRPPAYPHLPEPTEHLRFLYLDLPDIVRDLEATSSSNPRHKKLVRLVRHGKTLQHIGDELGVTRERARQLILAAGIYHHWDAIRWFYRYYGMPMRMKCRRGPMGEFRKAAA